MEKQLLRICSYCGKHLDASTPVRLASFETQEGTRYTKVVCKRAEGCILKEGETWAEFVGLDFDEC